jgi:hypothetical protein
MSDVSTTSESEDKTQYCYHCKTCHKISEMSFTINRNGRKIPRCIKSIKAAKSTQQTRDKFGKEVSASNKAESHTMSLRRLNTERQLNKP